MVILITIIFLLNCWLECFTVFTLFTKAQLPRVVHSLADHYSSALQQTTGSGSSLSLQGQLTAGCLVILPPPLLAFFLPSFPKRIMTRQLSPYQLPYEKALAHFRPTLPHLSSNLSNSIVIFFEPVGVTFFQDCPLSLKKYTVAIVCSWMIPLINYKFKH